MTGVVRRVVVVGKDGGKKCMEIPESRINNGVFVVVVIYVLHVCQVDILCSGRGCCVMSEGFGVDVESAMRCLWYIFPPWVSLRVLK